MCRGGTQTRHGRTGAQMLKRVGSHFLHNVVAYLALFVALSGTAYAAAKFTGADIIDESLTGADILNGSLGGADTGVVAAFGSNNATNPLPHVAQVSASTTVTVARPSTLVVFGHTNGLVICGAPAPPNTTCQITTGLYLDGNPIPASARGFGLLPGDGKSFEEQSVFGLVTNVAPGVHTVSIAVGTTDGDQVQVGFQGERVAVIAVPE